MATVSDIILDALPRLAGTKPTGTTFYQAINYVASMLARRLINRRSDLLVQLEKTWTITPASQYYDLPTGFVSLRERPFNPNFSSYDDGDEDDLGTIAWVEPIQEDRTYYNNRTCLTPEAYELLGQQIVFYPALDPNVTSVDIKARYYSLPTAISSPTVTDPNTHIVSDVQIPFNGMFDQAFFQGAPRVVAKGLAVIQADPDFEAFLNAEVDTILNARVVPFPDRRTKRSTFI